ncbi:putative nucleotidyltransferase, ribonuclease H [Tanacetum coccineum]
MFLIRIHHGGKFEGIQTEGKSDPLFNYYLRPLTSLDEGLYALACEDDVRCLATLDRSLKLIEVIEDVMGQLSSGIENFGLSHDESFGVDDLNLNLNEHVGLNVSQIETQSELHVSEEPDVEVKTHEPSVEEVRTQEPIMKEVIVEDYVSSGEDVEQGIGQEDESAPSDEQFFYDVEGIYIAYETKYEGQSNEVAGKDDDDDEDDYFLELDKGNIENVKAPAIAVDYWRLPADATLRDVVMVVREDEAHHRDVNHFASDIHYEGRKLKDSPAPIGYH